MGWGREGGLVPLLPHVPVEVVAVLPVILVERLPVVIDRGTIRPPIVLDHLRLLPLLDLLLVEAAEVAEHRAVEGGIAQGAVPRAVGHLLVVEDAEGAGVAGGGGRGGGDAHAQMVHRIRWNTSG